MYVNTHRTIHWKRSEKNIENRDSEGLLNEDWSIVLKHYRGEKMQQIWNTKSVITY